MSDKDASDFQSILHVQNQDGPVCRCHVRNKSCVLDLWNLKNDTRDILITNYEDVARVHEDAMRKLLLWNLGLSVMTKSIATGNIYTRGNQAPGYNTRAEKKC